MKTQIFIGLFICCFAVGCATIHNGNKGVSLAKQPTVPIIVSAKTVTGPFSESFQLLDLTIENTSERWVRINDAIVEIGDPAKAKLSVVVGQDLRDWAQAVQLKAAQDEYNNKLAQVGLVAAGAVAAASASQSNDDLRLAGSGAMLTGALWATYSDVNQAYKWANSVKKVPEQHLYHPFAVPGKMFLRRWLLLNKPADARLKTLVVTFETTEAEKETYEIKID